jgi:hypothetical protein
MRPDFDSTVVYNNNGDYRRSNGGAGIGNILGEIFGRP